jgi:hypothetical protein
MILHSILNMTREVVLQEFENKRVQRREVRNTKIRGVKHGGGEGKAQGQITGRFAAEIEIKGLRRETAAGSNNRRHRTSSDYLMKRATTNL